MLVHKISSGLRRITRKTLRTANAERKVKILLQRLRSSLSCKGCGCISVRFAVKRTTAASLLSAVENVQYDYDNISATAKGRELFRELEAESFLPLLPIHSLGESS